MVPFYAGDHVPVPMARDCVSDQFLIAALTVSVRAVEKIYADLPISRARRKVSIAAGLIVSGSPSTMLPSIARVT
jgi:hypothetical protein